MQGCAVWVSWLLLRVRGKMGLAADLGKPTRCPGRFPYLALSSAAPDPPHRVPEEPWGDWRPGMLVPMGSRSRVSPACCSWPASPPTSLMDVGTEFGPAHSLGWHS